MADIAASDVTYTLVNARTMGDSRKLNRVRLAFGNGTLTYPAGGIPVTIGKLGCPTVVESMIVVDKGTSTNAYNFMYDQSAVTLVMVNPSHTHDIVVMGTQGTAGTQAISVISGTLGMQGVVGTVVGASSGTKGGVVAVALAEASTVAIAAQTIEVEVIGY